MQLKTIRRRTKSGIQASFKIGKTGPQAEEYKIWGTVNLKFRGVALGEPPREFQERVARAMAYRFPTEAACLELVRKI